MKKLVLVAALVLSLSFASAYDFTAQSSNDLESYESMINDRTEDAPAFMSGLLGNQTINLVVEKGSSNTTAGAKIEGLTLTELKKEGYEDPSIQVVTDQKTVENITNSDEPFNTAVAEYNDGDITYTADGFWNKIKLGIAEAFLTR